MKKLLCAFLSAIMLVTAVLGTAVTASANTVPTAPTLTINKKTDFPIKGDSYNEFDYNYYLKFVPNKTGYYKVTVTFNNSSTIDDRNETCLYIYDSKSDFIDFSDYNEILDSCEVICEFKANQTYYFRFESYSDNNFTASCTVTTHTHNYSTYIDKATDYYDGCVDKICNVCDYEYKTVIPKIDSIKLSQKSYIYDGKVKTPKVIIKDRTGKQLTENKDYTLKYESGRKNVDSYGIDITFKGNYEGYNYLSFDIKGTLKSASLSKTSYTYTGKTIKPSVKSVKGNDGIALYDYFDYSVSYSKGCKNVGQYTVTIKGKDYYTGTIKKTFKINPKGTSLSSVSAKKKAFTVKWKKQATQTTGYQIQYSTDKKFKKNNKTVTVSKNKTTSKSISKLKAKKKYYVRIRTYKTVGKTKYYSSWSKVKTVTTKK